MHIKRNKTWITICSVHENFLSSQTEINNEKKIKIIKMLKRITGTRKEAKQIDVRRKVRKRIGKTQT
jgi:ribosomal protein L7/L12